MLRLDSARRIGLETKLTMVLIVVVGCCTGGEESLAEFLLTEFGTFLLEVQEPKRL